MKIGDLVTMDFTGRPEGDEWGVGIIVEIDDRIPDNAAVLWSKLGLSWDPLEMMMRVDEI